MQEGVGRQIRSSQDKRENIFPIMFSATPKTTEFPSGTTEKRSAFVAWGLESKRVSESGSESGEGVSQVNE